MRGGVSDDPLLRAYKLGGQAKLVDPADTASRVRCTRTRAVSGAHTGRVRWVHTGADTGAHGGAHGKRTRASRVRAHG